MKVMTTNLHASKKLAALFLSLCFAVMANAGNPPAPGQSSAFGNTLAGWQDTYLRWEVGNITVSSDANGNPVVGNVALMPLPNVPGDGTPGSLVVTLNMGEAFFLPMVQEAGTSYTDGTPNDPLLPLSFFTSFSVSLKIDGVTVINNANAMNYYSQFYFAPPIPFPFGNINSIIWFQGFGIAHAPLRPGIHIIKLDEKAGQALPPNFGGGFPEYHNTWTVTVLPAP